VIRRLNATVVDILAEPELRQRLIDLAYEIPSRAQQTPEALGGCNRPKSKSGGPSSGPPTSRRNDRARNRTASVGIKTQSIGAPLASFHVTVIKCRRVVAFWDSTLLLRYHLTS
jgi:hypothetical protein